MIFISNMLVVFFAVLLNVFPVVSAFPTVPDSSQTMGVLCTEQDQDFQEFRYTEKIPYCSRNVSSQLKRAIYLSYDIPTECIARYTIDHFYPLSIGGNNSRKNLWPEHKLIKALRQNLEEELYQAVKWGQTTQARALATIKRAKLNPPLEELELTTDECDQPELIEQILQKFKRFERQNTTSENI